MTLTPNASNQLAALEPVISEIMYHPAADNTNHEYVVIQNDTGADVDLWNAVGPWRINGIGYTLPSNTVIGADEALTIVAFDPGDAMAVSNFLAAHNLSGTSPVLLGPHDGTLSNTGERLALERPQDADAVDDSISWVTVDEVIYLAAAPWPDASTNGTALHRVNLRHSGSDPLNWTALQPTLARLSKADSDGDGMDDDWERQYFGGTNRVNGGAYEDWDEDGLLNLYEEGAGTNPTNALSLLAIVSLTTVSGDVISWWSVTGKQYSVWRSTNLNLPAGFEFLQGPILATPPLNTHTAASVEADCRFYRISVDPE